MIHQFCKSSMFSLRLDLPSPLSRLVFDSAHKCKVWQERLLESLRRSRQTLKSMFAFVHRAYSRDQRMERSQQGEEVEPDPVTALLSLKGEGRLRLIPAFMSQV